MNHRTERSRLSRIVLFAVGAVVLCLAMYVLWPREALQRASRAGGTATPQRESVQVDKVGPSPTRKAKPRDAAEETRNDAAVVRFRDSLGAVIPFAEVCLPRDRPAGMWTAETKPPITLVRIPADLANGTDSRQFEVRAHGYMSKRFELTAASFSEGGQTVVLDGALAARVRVSGAEGAGIRRASVTCESFDSDASTYRAVGTKVTTGTGEVEFRGLPGQSSRLRFAVACDGYRPTTSTIRPRMGGPGHHDIEITLVPLGSPVLRGVVRQLEKPIENVIVELIRGRTRLRTNTSAAGEFSFPEGPAGRVRLRIRPDTSGAVPASWFVPQTMVLKLPRYDPMEVSVGLGRIVKVVVTDRSGKPKPNVGVWHWECRDLMPAPAQTDENGIAIIGGVRHGAAAIGVAQNGVVTRTAVPASEDGVRVIVDSRRVLRGKVVDSNGSPVAGASVRSPGFVRALKTDSRGRFVCENTVPGPGIVLVELGYRAVQYEYRADDTDLRIVLP